MKIAFPTKEAQSLRWIVTKKEMCEDDYCHPEQSIMGGVKYIKRLYDELLSKDDFQIASVLFNNLLLRTFNG
jgi:hypothetical protein